MVVGLLFPDFFLKVTKSYRSSSVTSKILSLCESKYSWKVLSVSARLNIVLVEGVLRSYGGHRHIALDSYSSPSRNSHLSQIAGERWGVVWPWLKRKSSRGAFAVWIMASPKLNALCRVSVYGFSGLADIVGLGEFAHPLCQLAAYKLGKSRQLYLLNS